MSNALRKVSYGLGEVSDVLGKVSDGLEKLSDGIPAYISLFQPHPTVSTLFHTIPAYSRLF